MLIAGVSSLSSANPAAEGEAARIIQATGVKGGFVVHLGAGDGQLTAALRRNSSYQVQGLDRDATNVQSAREWLLAEKLSGPVTVDLWRPGPLPYIDNLVNLLVATNLDGVSREELNRVLAPNGVAYYQEGGAWRKWVKPRPTDIDDWTHYYYDARGNAVSRDLQVSTPEGFQWIGSPRWSRHHDRINDQVSFVTGRSVFLDGGLRFFKLDAASGRKLFEEPYDKVDPETGAICNEKVFGYGREPQYLKWTTTMQNQLFSSSRVAPDVKPQLGPAGGRGGRWQQTGPGVLFPNDSRLNPAGKAITVEAWVQPDTANGVILAHGGPAYGYALSLRDGAPVFHIRNGGDLVSVAALAPLGAGWHYLVGVLDHPPLRRWPF